MRCIAKFVGAGLVLIAATACAGQEAASTQPAGGKPPVSASAPPLSDVATPTPPGAGPQPANPPGRPKQVVPEGSVSVPASQIDATALPADYPREVSTSNGGTVLSIKAEEGGCGHTSAAPVEQSAQRVVINLTETQAHTDQMCTMEIRTPVVSATLDAPLGDRTVVLNVEPRMR
jgi:hypothetical protein